MALLLALWLAFAGGAVAQKQSTNEKVEDSKIHIELKSEENGKARTFKRDYSSREEMLADEELKKFLNEKDLNLYFYGDTDRQISRSYSFSFPPLDDDRVHIFSDVDSLLSFHFDGDGAYQFNGKNGGSFHFSLPGDAGKDVWMFGGDSVFAKKLAPFDIDSIRMYWKDRFDENGGNAFFYEWNDEDSGNQTARILFRKKVTISKLHESEAVLDKMASKKMGALDPLELIYYPNPSNGRFTLKMKLNGNQPLGVSITDLSGKVIFEEQLKTFDGNYSREFDLTGQPAGIYLLQVVQGNNRLVRKIMIN